MLYSLACWYIRRRQVHRAAHAGRRDQRATKDVYAAPAGAGRIISMLFLGANMTDAGLYVQSIGRGHRGALLDSRSAHLPQLLRWAEGDTPSYSPPMVQVTHLSAANAREAATLAFDCNPHLRADPPLKSMLIHFIYKHAYFRLHLCSVWLADRAAQMMEWAERHHACCGRHGYNRNG